jgi:hypothetical protein
MYRQKVALGMMVFHFIYSHSNDQISYISFAHIRDTLGIKEQKPERERVRFQKRTNYFLFARWTKNFTQSLFLSFLTFLSKDPWFINRLRKLAKKAFFLRQLFRSEKMPYSISISTRSNPIFENENRNIHLMRRF